MLVSSEQRPSVTRSFNVVAALTYARGVPYARQREGARALGLGEALGGYATNRALRCTGQGVAHGVQLRVTT